MERRAAETSIQREARLARHREKDGARRTAKTAEGTETHRQQRRFWRHRSLALEETEARLQQQRVYDQRRLASEMSQDTEARLQQQRAYDQRRLASEVSQLRHRGPPSAAESL